MRVRGSHAVQHIVAPLASGVKLTIVLDCCHSGTGADLPFLLEHRARRGVCEDNPAHSAGDVLCISGCEDEQTSADATDRYSRPAGALTSAFTEVMGPWLS